MLIEFNNSTGAETAVDPSNPLPIEEQGAIGHESNPYSTDYGTAEGLIAVSGIETPRMRAWRLGLMVTQSATSVKSISATTLTTLFDAASYSVTAGKTAYVFDIWATINGGTANSADYIRVALGGTVEFMQPVGLGQPLHLDLGGYKLAAGSAIAVQGYITSGGTGSAAIHYAEVTTPS